MVHWGIVSASEGLGYLLNRGRTGNQFERGVGSASVGLVGGGKNVGGEKRLVKC